MNNTPSSNRDLIILEQIEQDPDATQASLADQLGVAVGTINWHLKRLISKGYVKVRRIERRKLRYIITPDGIALRTRLAVDYIQTSFQLYRLIRQRMSQTLAEARQAGYSSIRLEEEGDIADICRLTCLEQDVPIVQDAHAPVLRINGMKLWLDYEGAAPNLSNPFVDNRPIGPVAFQEPGSEV